MRSWIIFQVVVDLHEALSTYGRESDVQYVLPELDPDRNPDLAVVFRDIPTLDVKGRRMSVLGVEVVSPVSRAHGRDYEDKRADYLAVGLLEYWIVDPEEGQVTVLLRREADGVATWEERICRGAEVIGGDLLPGFAGTVAELWADLDNAN